MAESWSIPLTTEFSTAGQPLSLKLEVEGIVADLTIATTENEGFKDLQAENVSSSNKPVKREIARPGANGAAGQTGRATGKTPTKKKNSLHFSRDAPANFPQAQTAREEADQGEVTITDHLQDVDNVRNHSEEPLFYPGGSQEGGRPLSQAQMMQAASQRELDQMDPEELAGIFDDNDLDLDDNENGDSNDYDESTKPSKRPKSHSNAEEILGKSILNLGAENENDDGQDDDEEAPGTVPPAQEGSNSVSRLCSAGAGFPADTARASGYSIDHCLMNNSGRERNKRHEFYDHYYENKAFIASKKAICLVVFIPSPVGWYIYKNRTSMLNVPLPECLCHVHVIWAKEPLVNPKPDTLMMCAGTLP